MRRVTFDRPGVYRTVRSYSVTNDTIFVGTDLGRHIGDGIRFAMGGVVMLRVGGVEFVLNGPRHLDEPHPVRPDLATGATTFRTALMAKS